MLPFSFDHFLNFSMYQKLSYSLILFSLTEHYRDSPKGETRHFKNKTATRASALRNPANSPPAADLLKVTRWDKPDSWRDKWRLSRCPEDAPSDTEIKQSLGEWDTTFVQPRVLSRPVPPSISECWAEPEGRGWKAVGQKRYWWRPAFQNRIWIQIRTFSQ